MFGSLSNCSIGIGMVETGGASVCAGAWSLFSDYFLVLDIRPSHLPLDATQSWKVVKLLFLCHRYMVDVVDLHVGRRKGNREMIRIKKERWEEVAGELKTRAG